jgi:diguanylate cyclase (GGDEF)-like protein/PAS domain S-box-containing protein
MSGPSVPASLDEAAERLSRAVVDGLEEGVLVTDAELRPLSWNASALRILGISAEQLAADGLASRAVGVLCYEDGKPVTRGDNPPRRALRQGAPVRATLRRTAPAGSEHWITVLARPLGGAHGTTRQGVVCTFADVTRSVEVERRLRDDLEARREAEAQATFLAYHDRLTGLPNRALLEEQLTRDLTRARRSGVPVALLYFDLDNFKLVNDSLGHAAGDAVLRETAQRVSELTRGGDVLARQGGDEFLLLLDCGDGDPCEVAQVAGDRIAAALERPFEISGAEFHVGASIGVALFPEHASDPESLFMCADSAMYQAKRAGGGTVAFYEHEANDARQRLSLTSRLRRAIDAGELRLHFQPIVAVADGTLVAVEALVRWQDPVEGLMAPGTFIHVAEETGLIDGIGAWVLEALCEQAVAWAAEDFRPRLCFNLSPRQLRRADLVDSIAARIAAHELDPAQFCAELTETALLSDARRQRSLLDELHEAGLAIAIDDFGSGHSSLARLRDLPVQVLKVDRSFLARVPADRGSTAIVAAVLELAKALGMTTVVEGVEQPEQLDFLRRHACPLAQGFLLGRPVPADELARLPVAS